MVKFLLSLLRDLLLRKRSRKDPDRGQKGCKEECMSHSHHHRPRVLFILKYREDSWGDYCDYSTGHTNKHGQHLSSGLFNSANFVKNMLLDLGIEAKLVHVKDGHKIDKEMNEFKPTHVILEAFWCPPFKFDVLVPKHPHVQFIIRNHSEIPFLGTEGIAMEWFWQYIKHHNVFFSSNSPRAHRETIALARIAHPHWTEEKLRDKFVYLPNYYPTNFETRNHHHGNFEEIHIGLFGSIRPLKNHFLQAIAAIEYAESVGKNLVLHMNGTRIEGRGDSIIKNIRNLFDGLKEHTNHRLVEHGWLDLDKFLHLVGRMDIGMQVSFSETFNIVAANFTDKCVPCVISAEVPWGDSALSADPNDSSDMVAKLTKAHRLKKKDHEYNPHAKSLRKYSEKTKRIWDDYFDPEDEV